MEIKGAYTTIIDFLSTYKECKIVSSFSHTNENQWSFEANRVIKIPDYQREFRWEQKQLEELYNDINRGNCYLGQIVVSHKNRTKIYNLVDGQQRITSIIILLTVLFRQFYIYNDSINLRKFELHKAENNSESQEDENQPASPRLSFDANCFADFQEFISQIYNDFDANTKEFKDEIFAVVGADFYNQQERYMGACSELNTILIKDLESKRTKPEKLVRVKEIIENIFKTRISVVVFEGNSVGESEKVFLDINEKGLRLDNEDILKAYYFQSITSETDDLALNTWTQLKKNYFELQEVLKNSNKITLDVWMNFMLQVSLFTDQDNDYDFDKFDNELRYGTNDKKHICQLFTDSELQTAFERASDFLLTLKNLLEYIPNSPFYCEYMRGANSTSRPIFHMLLSNMCKADMKLVFIALSKIWWIRKNNNENILLCDIIQLFSFYIISNISGLKKEKSLISKAFISSKDISSAYEELFLLEKQLLSVSSEKALTLKRDQEKAEYLSFNIQMFYNVFIFNKDTRQWEIKIGNQEFLGNYQVNRNQYVRDHFLIQNGKTIVLFDGSVFEINQSMHGLKKRAYNFIYHKDTYGNIDFVTRLNTIYGSVTEESPLTDMFGPYELDYFKFVSEQFRLYYMNGNVIPTWEEAVEKYKKDTMRDFPKIISYILQERCTTWNRLVGSHIIEQMEL